MALIDLGEVRDDPEPAVRRGPGVSRRWRFALVLGLVLVTLAGAAPVPRRISVTVPGRAGSEAFLVGDQLVVVVPPVGGAWSDRELVAYDLPDGGPSASSTLRARVTAYGLDRLDRRWTAELPSVGYVSTCGAMLCVWQQPGGVRLLDRATGRTVWRDPRWMAAVPVGDRLVATTSVSSVREEVFVLDAATGRELADLGTWNGLRTPVDGRPPIASRQIRDRGLLVAEFDVVRAPSPDPGRAARHLRRVSFPS
ncbi:hypothetical protein [Micromonospora inyonensis]|uniref:hypothetical protein n=1 Tax=Micromonospora inyonensis TaxID=47866 RepID=UPI000AFA5B5C|nr:hypothetical protein [Micromonospora inyonensis]